MYKMYLALNNPQWLICHKTKQNYTKQTLHDASVFEWHKRFKEGMESVKDDERCGRSK